MLDRVISGGQTGVDQAALRAARGLGVPTGGVAPRLFLVEAPGGGEFVPDPSLAGFGLVECELPRLGPPGRDDPVAYQAWCGTCLPPRTRANVAAADGTLILASPGRSRGTALTARYCGLYPGLPWLSLLFAERDGSWRPTDERHTPGSVAAWIADAGIRVLNVAGPRESTAPGIGAGAERFLTSVFRLASRS